jgi:dimethylargininase
MIESQLTGALVRGIPERYAEATRAYFGGGGIDLGTARVQHRRYREALGHLGLALVEIPIADDLPDSCFVEDTVVVAEGRALVARSSHPGRRDEATQVRRILVEMGMDVVDMEPPATLDGGDVLRIGRRFFLSRSGRTNAAGMARLASAFAEYEVVHVPLPDGVLHLKCVCSSPAPGMVVVAENTVEQAFVGLRTVLIPKSESYAANIVGLGGTVLTSAGYPRTAEALGAAGLRVVLVDTSEFRKGDGSLTCLSVLF